MIKKFWWFHRFLFHDFYCGFYSSNDLNIVQQKIFVFNMTYCCNNIFIHTLCLFMRTTIIYQEWINLWLQSNKFFNSTTSCFIFRFTNHLFVWINIIFWLRWIFIKIKHFFILTKVFKNIFGINMILNVIIVELVHQYFTQI